MRIVFMGTPEFAVETLKALVEANYNVVAVVTGPDKPRGRHGSLLQPTPVKVYAEEQNIPILQPESLKSDSFFEELSAFQPDVQVVVAFRMLPERVWSLPRFGTFNVHASLLPQYRGAAPINWAIINGETTTGVTTFFLDHDIDTGRIIHQAEMAIPDTANVEYVYDKLMVMGANLAVRTLEAIVSTDGNVESKPQQQLQTNAVLKPAPKIFKETCRIEWNKQAKQIHDFVRGLSPIPGSWTTFGSVKTLETDEEAKVLKIYKTSLTDRKAVNKPGTIIVEGADLYVNTLDTMLKIEELQLSGKRKMMTSDFVNGLKETDDICLK